MYQDNGSTLIFDTNAGELWSYNYDIFNRLVKVSKSTAGTAGLVTVAEYTYDAENLRIKKSSVKNGDTWFVYGLNGEVLFEETAKDTTRYVYVNGRHFAMVETDKATNTSSTFFYSLDHLGSTVMITDSAGKVVWQNEATPFGEWSGEIGVMHLKGKFTGKDLDEETGLYYYNARWMDPETGRFTTSDPNRDGRNWYVYCYSNPMRYTDPSGLSGQKEGYRKYPNLSSDEFYDVNGNPNYEAARDALIATDIYNLGLGLKNAPEDFTRGFLFGETKNGTQQFGSALAFALMICGVPSVSSVGATAEASETVISITTASYRAGGEVFNANIVMGNTTKNIAIIGRNMDGTILPIAKELQEGLGSAAKVSTFSNDTLTGLKGPMLERFNAAQEEINILKEKFGRYLTPEEYQQSSMFKLNREWAESQKAAGSTFVDLGTNTAKTPGVGAYEMEKEVVYGGAKQSGN